MTETKENILHAFAGESQANRKYLFFAEQADKEGLKQVAKLFRAAADAETVHARNHLNVLKGIKTTKENLQAAISGENHEFTEMYPEFIKQADLMVLRKPKIVSTSRTKWRKFTIDSSWIFSANWIRVILSRKNRFTFVSIVAIP